MAVSRMLVARRVLHSGSIEVNGKASTKATANAAIIGSSHDSSVSFRMRAPLTSPGPHVGDMQRTGDGERRHRNGKPSAWR